MSDTIETPKDDLETRVGAFNEKLKVLLGEYNLALSAVAHITQDGRIAATPQLVDGDAIKKAREEKQEQPQELNEA